jgi:hypothetical protein
MSKAKALPFSVYCTVKDFKKPAGSTPAELLNASFFVEKRWPENGKNSAESRLFDRGRAVELAGLIVQGHEMRELTRSPKILLFRGVNGTARARGTERGPSCCELADDASTIG